MGTSHRVRWVWWLAALITVSLVVVAGCAPQAQPEGEVDIPAAPVTQDTETSDEAAPESAPAGGPVSLKLAVWDETESSANDSIEVWTKGLGSWYPDLQFGGDNTVIGPYQHGDEVEVYVYPDGRDATEVKFTITITDEMISESDRDMVRVDLYDDRIEVLSTGLPDINAAFPR